MGSTGTPAVLSVTIFDGRRSVKISFFKIGELLLKSRIPKAKLQYL